MLSKNTIKYIQSLKLKKNRDNYKTFVAEGNKLISDLLGHMKCQYLIATSDYISQVKHQDIEHIIEVKEQDIKSLSFQKNPQQSLAVFHQHSYTLDNKIENKLTIVLDEIQDPGNMGTIVRLADWYGIENVICSNTTADIYNPKTVQATMGALARVKVHYTDLTLFLEKHKHIPVYGTFLEGDNIYQQELTNHGIIIMGNEGNGVSKEVAKFVNRKLFIPPYPSNVETSESLNVAIATAIVCSEFRRRVI